MRGNDNEPWARRLARCFPGSHCVISETNCYVSIEAAIEHYEGRCDNPWATVKAKIASGAIAVGEPPAGAPGEFLVFARRRKALRHRAGVRRARAS
jgi:hypothetical protein